ncbi:hypothetical protein ACFL26_01745 [Patescibacteria group bacterium]
MHMVRPKGRTITRAGAATAVAALLLYAGLPIWLTAPVAGALLYWLARGIGWRIAGPDSGGTGTAVGLVTVFTALALSQAACFYVSHMSRLTVLLALAVMCAVAAWPQLAVPKPQRDPPTRRIRALAAAVIVGDLLLLAVYLSSRTAEAIRTPWDAVPLAAIPLFALVTWLLLLLLRAAPNERTHALLALHLFVAYGMSELVYAFGFGFDPFIHRTAEDFLAQNGFIEPKQPYYIGHYALVAALNWLSGAAVDTVDRFLVPVLAALTLPWLAPFALAKWGLPRRRAAAAALGVLLLPMMPLTFTVPYSLTVLLLMLIALLLPVALDDRRWLVAVVLMALAALAVHPLLGSLCAILVAAGLLLKHRGGAVAYVATVAVSAFAVPAMFALNNWRNGHPPLATTDPLSRLDLFLGLFRNPFTAHPEIAFTPWDILYGYRTVMPLLFVALVALGLFALRRRPALASLPHVPVAVGAFISAFLLATTITVPDVIAHEQLEFALRLKHALGLVLLPLFLLGISRLLPKRKAATRRAVPILLMLAAAVTVSWYLTYPQENVRNIRTGWGISRADFLAAQSIEEAAAGREYVALSGQMLSVAALRLNGFEDFRYPLPTGARLYEFYLSMAYYRHDRLVMLEAMAENDVNLGYFALHRYAPGYARTVAALAPQADRYWLVEGGRIAVFEFRAE